jgi:hypothetical protein
VTGLKLNRDTLDSTDESVAICVVKVDATPADIRRDLKSTGKDPLHVPSRGSSSSSSVLEYAPPDGLLEQELLISVTDSVSEFDATALGGLQIAR